MNKERTTRRGRLLTTFFCDGRATYRLWYIFLYTLRFYLCFYTFKIVTSTISQPALYDQNSVHRKKGHIHTMNFHNTSRFPYPEAFQTLQNYKTYSLPHHILIPVLQ